MGSTSEVVDARAGSAGVRCRGLSKSYGDRSVLTDVTFAVQPGEVVAVTGVSGSGKSTLLLALAGLLAPDVGEVTIGATDLWALGDDGRTSFRLEHIGLVFQFGQLVGELTTIDNVCLPLLLRGQGRVEASAAAHALLTELGIADVAGHYPHQLSGGQEQRAAIARALVVSPSVVLADEPTGSLDSAASEAVLTRLLDAARARRAAVVLVTHDERIAGAADRAVRLHDGRIVSDTARR